MMGKIKERGITLVALVVTIIIILILAGVTISQITGDNGLISRTKQAKEEYETEALKEEIRLAVLDKRLEKNGELSEEEITKLLDEYGDVITDEEGKVILKPDGTSYEIAYEDIINGETTSDITDGGSSEGSQDKVEVSKVELENIKTTLDTLKEEVENLKTEKDNISLSMDNLRNDMPLITKIGIGGNVSLNTEETDTGLSCTIPKNSVFCLSFDISTTADCNIGVIVKLNQRRR